jgi:biopolymer transport protein ExbB
VRLVASTVLLAACGFDAKLPATAGDAAATDGATIPACFGERCRRKTITIDPAKVTGGPHVQFPLFVQIDDPDFANASGTDFVFTAADGTTVLAFERERFAGTELVAWVAVPMLGAGAPTTLRLYYGDPTAADLQDARAVWDADYAGVWHLAETTGGNAAILDATANANAGTDAGGVTLGMNGKLARGARFDGVDARIAVPQAPSLTACAATATASMWINFDDAVIGTYQRLWMSENTFANDRRGMEWATNAEGYYYYYPADASGPNYVAIQSPFTNGAWHHIALTHDFATKSVQLFVDGTPRTTIGDPAMTWMNVTTAADWYWGGKPASAKFAGMMDEIRVSKVVRDAGWIATEYANQNAPSAFYAISD